MNLSGIQAIDNLLAGTGQPIGPGSDKSAVSAVQDLLRGHGFVQMPGLLGDGRGLFGPKTKAVVAVFCQSQGLPATLDQAALQALLDVPAKSPVMSQAYITLKLGATFTGQMKLATLLTGVNKAGRFADVLANLGGGGLGAGILPWVQRTGGLHSILAALDQHHNALAAAFDSEANVAGVLTHTAKTDGGLDATGKTTDPNFDLIRKPWTTRFRQAGLDTTLQAAQAEAARWQMGDWFQSSVLPNMPLLATERLVAFGLDMILQFGVKSAEEIYNLAKAAGPDLFLPTRMRDISVAKLRSLFKEMPSVALAAQVRRDFLLTTQLLSDDKFVSDAGTSAANPKPKQPDYFLPLGDEPFQAPVHGTNAQWFILADTAFPKMADDIKNAAGPDGFIYMLNWYCEVDLPLITLVHSPDQEAPPAPNLPHPSTDPNSLRELLTTASAQGTEIKAMFWTGPLTEETRRQYPRFRKWFDKNFPSILVNEKAGAFVDGVSGTPIGVAIRDSEANGITGTHHQKLLVVGNNGKVTAAYVGGIEYNPDRQYQVPDEKGSPLFDFTVRFKDRAAWLALKMFQFRWEHTALVNGALLKHADIPAPTDLPTGNLVVQMTQTRKSDTVEPRAVNTAGDAIVNAIGKAKRYFYIEDQYFVGNPRLRQAIFDALSRSPTLTGIVVLTPDEDVTDFHDPAIAAARRRMFLQDIESMFLSVLDRLDPAKVKPLTHLQDRLLMFERLGTNRMPSSSFSYVHSKLVIVDDEAALFGSVNMNNRGWSHDTEIYATVVDTLAPDGAAVNDKGWVHRFRGDMWSLHFVANCDGDIDKDIAYWRQIAAQGQSLSPKPRVRKYVMDADFPAPSLVDIAEWALVLDPA